MAKIAVKAVKPPPLKRPPFYRGEQAGGSPVPVSVAQPPSAVRRFRQPRAAVPRQRAMESAGHAAEKWLPIATFRPWAFQPENSTPASQFGAGSDDNRSSCYTQIGLVCFIPARLAGPSQAPHSLKTAKLAILPRAFYLPNASKLFSPIRYPLTRFRRARIAAQRARIRSVGAIFWEDQRK